MPLTSSSNNAVETARVLTEFLINPAPASPFHVLEDRWIQVLCQLSNIVGAVIPEEAHTKEPTLPL